jgi:hypothetical protein
MSENPILNQMVILMSYVEELQDLPNEQKKAYVTDHLFDVMKIKDELRPLLSEVIDLLISVDRRKIQFRKQLKKKFYIC